MSEHPGPQGGVAAVRGAVPVSENTSERIVEATSRLLLGLLEINRIDPTRIVSALFTTTADLDADFPAHAARRLGWSDVPMLNAREIPVPGAMPRVVRVLLTVQGVPPGTSTPRPRCGRISNTAFRVRAARPPPPRRARIETRRASR
jgi:chorismate mutase